jgi:hypothetical protein
MKTAETTIDQLEQLLIGDETHIARLRARQIATLGALDLAQVPYRTGPVTSPNGRPPEWTWHPKPP